MRLPPLNAIRAFEAAARHGGYIGAAEELNVTRGAISRHIKGLEADLGVPLFHRHPKGVTLTEAGARLGPALSTTFRDLSEALDRAKRDRPELKIICPPATSIRWLWPRLDRFTEAHPDIPIRLTTGFHHRDRFDDTEYDIGFSVEHWPHRGKNLIVEPLFEALITLACAPAVAERLHRLEDILGETLLHETSDRVDWTCWLRANPVPGLDVKSGDVFPNLDMAVKAAVMGKGVVMGDRVLCAEEFESGLLVAPFPETDTPYEWGAISLIGTRDRWDLPRVKAFREWIAEEARETRESLRGLST